MCGALIALALLCAPAADLHRYFTPDEIAEFHAFRKPRWVRAFADQAAQLLLFAAFIGFKLDRKMRERCDRAAARLPRSRLLARLWGDDTWSGAVLFALGWFGIALLIDLPQDLYFDYWQLKHYGLSTQSPLRHAALYLREAAFGAGALSMLAFGLYGLARRARRWWLLLGLPSAILIAVAGFADPARAQLDHDFTPLPPGPTRSALEDLLSRANVEYAGLFQIDAGRDTSTLDAFVVGQGPTRRIALFDTLVRELTPREAAAVVAHELGHLSEGRSFRLAFAALAVIPLLGLFAWVLRALGRTGRFGFTSDSDVTSLPAAMALAWLASTVALPLSQADSRARESRADRFALELTRDPEAFRNAMIKVTRAAKADLSPPALVVALLYSHPPMAERIGEAVEWAKAHGVKEP